MKLKEKTWTIVLIIAISGLAFLSGQVFFYNKRSAISIPSPVSTDNLGAKLLNYAPTELILTFREKKFEVSPQELKSWVESYVRSYTGKKEQRINQEKIRLYLQELSQKINIIPINARFSINNEQIVEFSPSQNGLTLNISESLAGIVSVFIQKDGGNIELVIDEIEPAVTLAKVNSLGINSLLGRGESSFAGSSNSRIHNINIGSKVFNGIILKPEEEFSFNKLLGPVGASNGYLPELVVKNGTLTPEYGGGLCQVSTTVFRAAIAAGLAILERHPHSLPVRYYDPQGFDATIYPGVSDLRFKNDTPAYIFLQSKIIGSKLYFEIYGTDDGRKVTIDGPHQYDVKASGALKAVLTRIITYADGTEKKDVFNSSYKAPSAFPTVRNPLE